MSEEEDREERLSGERADALRRYDVPKDWVAPHGEYIGYKIRPALPRNAG